MVTINVWSGVDYSGIFKFGEYETHERRELRFLSLLTQIRSINPDVVFIQEANPVASYSSRLADSLSFDEIHHVCNAGISLGPIGLPTNFKEGIAILARQSLCLKKIEVWKLAGSFGLYGDPITIHFGQSNFAIVGKVIVDDSPLYLINVHLSSDVPKDSILNLQFRNLYLDGKISEQALLYTLEIQETKRVNRELQIIRLIKYLELLPKDVPIIVGGDFNATPDSREIMLFQDSGKYFDTFTILNPIEMTSGALAYTWDYHRNQNVLFSAQINQINGNPKNDYEYLEAIHDSYSRRIDYIFLNQKFLPNDVINCRIVLDSVVQGVQASDHFGICADINLDGVLKSSHKEYKTITPYSESTFEPLPIVSYDTDVGFGYGAKAFLLNSLSLNESFDFTFFNSTKGERWYRFVFSIPDFELRQGKIYPLAFDFVVDYDKWIKNSFFGVGNSSKFEAREFYTKEPLEIITTLSRGFTQQLVASAGLKYKMIRNFNFSDTSKLRDTPPVQNASGAYYTSIFTTFRYDKRNSFINPSEGSVFQLEAEYAPKSRLSNVNFLRIAGTFQNYYVLFYPKTIFAVRLAAQRLEGNNLPVQVLMSVGGNNNLRGSPQDRYLDKFSVITNAELRFPIYWRFGGIVGYDIGKVWSSPTKFDLTRWSANPTIGLRFFMETFVVRADIGFGKETAGFYFNFGHIF